MSKLRRLLAWPWLGVWLVLGLALAASAAVAIWHGAWIAAAVPLYMAFAALAWVRTRWRRGLVGPEA